MSTVITVISIIIGAIVGTTIGSFVYYASEYKKNTKAFNQSLVAGRAEIAKANKRLALLNT